MKKTLTALALFALLPAGMALADDDAREAASEPVLSRHHDDKGHHRHGTAQTDPRHGVKAHDHRSHQGKEGRHAKRHRNSSGAGQDATATAPAMNVTPPANGLFGTATPPKVIMN